MRVLLIDSDTTLREGVRDLIAFNCPFVEIVESYEPQDAIRKTQDGGVNMVFIELRLSGQMMLPLLQRIKSINPGIEVTVFTSFDLPEYRQAAYANGADCFISKSADSAVDDILARVRGYLDTH